MLTKGKIRYAFICYQLLKYLLNEMYEDVALKGSINHSKVVYSTPTFGLLQG